MANVGPTSAEILRPVVPLRSTHVCGYHYRSSLNCPIGSVYYRVFAEDEAISRANLVYIDDLHLGRMSAEFVTPHTVANLNNGLSGFEDISEIIATSLFVSASNEKRSPCVESCVSRSGLHTE